MSAVMQELAESLLSSLNCDVKVFDWVRYASKDTGIMIANIIAEEINTTIIATMPF